MEKNEELSKKLGLNFDEVKDVLSQETLNRLAMSKIIGGIHDQGSLEEKRKNKCDECDKCDRCDRCTSDCSTSGYGDIGQLEPPYLPIE